MVHVDQQWFLSSLPPPSSQQSKSYVKRMLMVLKTMARQQSHHGRRADDGVEHRMPSTLDQLIKASHRRSIYAKILAAMSHHRLGTRLSELRRTANIMVHETIDHDRVEGNLEEASAQHIALKIRAPRRWHGLLIMQDLPKMQHLIIRVQDVTPKSFLNIIHHARKSSKHLDEYRLVHRLIWCMLCFQYTIFPYVIMSLGQAKPIYAFMKRINISADWFWNYFHVKTWIRKFAKRHRLIVHPKTLKRWFYAYVNQQLVQEMDLERHFALPNASMQLEEDEDGPSSASSHEPSSFDKMLSFCQRHDMFKYRVKSKSNFDTMLAQQDDRFWLKLAQKAQSYMQRHTRIQGDDHDDDEHAVPRLKRLARQLKTLSAYQRGALPFNFVRHGPVLFDRFQKSYLAWYREQEQQASMSQEDDDDQAEMTWVDGLWIMIFDWFHQTGKSLPKDAAPRLWRIACLDHVQMEQ